MYFILQLVFLPTLISAQNAITAAPPLVIKEGKVLNSKNMLGFYASDKMFDVNEGEYILKKFDNINALNDYINNHTNHHVPCFEFANNDRVEIKRIRSKKCKNRNMRFPSLVTPISWEKIDDNNFILHTRTRYFQSKTIIREKAIYSLEEISEGTYALRKKSIIESVSCP